MKMQTISVKLPAWAARGLRAEALEHGMTLNRMLADMLVRRLHQVRPDAEEEFREP